MWTTGSDFAELKSRICEDMENVQAWCEKLKMRLSLQITEVTIFSPRPVAATYPVFQVGDVALSYNKVPKLLGITLYEKLTFRRHIEKMENKRM